MRHGLLRLGAATFFGGCISASAAPGDLGLTAGLEQSTDDYGRSHAFAIEYREAFAPHLAASFAWRNDGHLNSHHRDGQVVQVWWLTRSAAPGLVFSAGLGPYRTYDTSDANHTYSVDHHAWGALASAALEWHFDSGMFADLRTNYARVANDFGSKEIAAGIGYRFADGASRSSDGGDAGAADRRWEVDVLTGRRVFNYHPTRTDPLQSVEARFRISEYLFGSVTYLHAGGANDYSDPRGQGLDWVSGAVAEFWLEKHLSPALAIGVGVGGLFARTPPTPTNTDSSSVPFLVTSITAAYAVTPAWVVRLTMDRVAARYNRDSDLVRLGVGYAF